MQQIKWIADSGFLPMEVLILEVALINRITDWLDQRALNVIFLGRMYVVLIILITYISLIAMEVNE